MSKNDKNMIDTNKRLDKVSQKITKSNQELNNKINETHKDTLIST